MVKFAREGAAVPMASDAFGGINADVECKMAVYFRGIFGRSKYSVTDETDNQQKGGIEAGKSLHRYGESKEIVGVEAQVSQEPWQRTWRHLFE